MPATPPNLIAKGNIRPCRFVKLDPSNDLCGLECDANELPIGVSQVGTDYPPITDSHITVGGNAAIAGESFRLFGDGEECLIEAGAAVAVGNLLKADADGKAVPIATTGTTNQNYGAVALQAASGDGVKIRAQVRIGTVRPAIT